MTRVSPTWRKVRGIAVGCFLLSLPAIAGNPEIQRINDQTRLVFPSQSHYYETTATVSDLRAIQPDGKQIAGYLWNEQAKNGFRSTRYVVMTERGKLSEPQTADQLVYLRNGTFDPLEGEPDVADLSIPSEPGQVYLVQFETQPLNSYREVLDRLGVKIHKFVPGQALLVNMDQAAKTKVEDLSFVRWVGAYKPAYRVEGFVLNNLDRAQSAIGVRRYNVQLFSGDAGTKALVRDLINDLGGKVDNGDADKFLIHATLNPDQLFELLNWDEIAFVDRWSEMEPDMDIARDIGGANFIETQAGYDGDGMRGEVFDTGFNTGHQDFASRPLLLHTANVSDSHGAATSGILFGDGAANPAARGLLPMGQGIVAAAGQVGNRYTHTGELLDAPYFAVLQTSSVGSTRVMEYTTISAAQDTRLFDWDILHCQSQSNAGSRDSRPEAWAKNVVSVGGIVHNNTLDRSDDCWNCGGGGSGSIGPAPDGRIKPDLSHFYDNIFTVTTGGATSYTSSFGGTSGATPITCGYFGLLFDMWADGIFGNPVDGTGNVFDNRPHLSMAKALMINTASPYAFTGATSDLSRLRQGWGMADVASMFNLRGKMFLINETDILSNLETKFYRLTVAPGEPALRATMAYLDPAALPSSAIQRINDLTLRVTSPSGTVYWGNNGLTHGLWSQPGGLPNQLDTVENVFVQNPEAGEWTIEVIAHEINEDSHVETPAMDADFSLVVSGVSDSAAPLWMRLTEDLPELQQEGTPLQVQIDVAAGDETLQGTPTLFYRSNASGSFTSLGMTLVSGNTYQAEVPGFDCTDQPELYFSAQGSGGATVRYPLTAPANTLSFDLGTIEVVFEDDMETDKGWTVGAADDTATTGIWERVDPISTNHAPELDNTPLAGVNAYITGQGALGDGPGVNDIDGGKTTLISPVIDLSGGDASISYWRWFGRTGAEDTFIVSVTNDGTNWTPVENLTTAGETNGSWLFHSFTVSDFVTPNATVQVRFVAADEGTGSLVEAGLDDFRVTRFSCEAVGCVPGAFDNVFFQWPTPNVLGLVQAICD